MLRGAQLLSVSEEGACAFVASLSTDEVAAIARGSFDRELHYWDAAQPDAVVQYLLVVDASVSLCRLALVGQLAHPSVPSCRSLLPGTSPPSFLLLPPSQNYCFWPDGELEYHHLAGGLKRALLADPSALDASRLAAIDGPGVRRLLTWPRPLPLEEERARLLREVGAALLEQYGGAAANLVRAAQGSAVRLVRLVAAAFPGFRDHCIYGGRQVFFYKRAQVRRAGLAGAMRRSQPFAAAADRPHAVRALCSLPLPPPFLMADFRGRRVGSVWGAGPGRIRRHSAADHVCR